jgi:hypothetical protein
MKAADKFKVGQRVRMTSEALAQKLDGVYVKRSTGVVTGFPSQASYGDPSVLVYVRRDGRASRECYSMNFWEPEPQGGELSCSSN